MKQEDILCGLDHVTIGLIQRINNLHIVALLTKKPTKLSYEFLDETLSNGRAKLTELSDSGSVPRIKFINYAKKPILMIDGEELLGCKQNRILNLSVLAPINKEIEIPVSCVERNRWSHSTQEFRQSDNFEFASLKSVKMNSVSESLRECQSACSDQSAVWREIDQKAQSLGSTSSSAAMDGIYENNKDQISDLLKQVKHVPNQIGCIFFEEKKVLGMELFASNTFFKKYINKILSGYLLDQLTSNEKKSNLAKRYAQKKRELVRIVEHYKKYIDDIQDFRSSALNIDEISNEKEFEHVKNIFEENELFLIKIRAKHSQYLYQLKRCWREIIELKKDLQEHENFSSRDEKEEQIQNKHSEEGKMFLNKIKEFSYEKYEGVGLGSNIRATKSGFVLGGLYYRNKVIHLSCVQG